MQHRTITMGWARREQSSRLVVRAALPVLPHPVLAAALWTAAALLAWVLASLAMPHAALAQDRVLVLSSGGSLGGRARGALERGLSAEGLDVVPGREARQMASDLDLPLEAPDVAARLGASTVVAVDVVRRGEGAHAAIAVWRASDQEPLGELQLDAPSPTALADVMTSHAGAIAQMIGAPTPVSSAPPQPPASTRSAPGRASIVTPLAIDASLGVVGRDFSYGGEGLERHEYHLPASIALDVGVELHPGLLLEDASVRDAAGIIGLTASMRLLPYAEAPTLDGSSAATNMVIWSAGLTARLAVDSSIFRVDAALGGWHFMASTASTQSSGLGVPTLDVLAFRPSLSFEHRVHWLTIHAAASVIVPFQLGAVSGPRWFPGAAAMGWSGQAGVGVRLDPAIELRGSASYESLYFTLDPVVASGTRSAQDQVIGGWLGAHITI